MEVLAEKISKVETAELGGQEFQLAVLTALLQVTAYDVNISHFADNTAFILKEELTIKFLRNVQLLTLFWPPYFFLYSMHGLDSLQRRR